MRDAHASLGEGKPGRRAREQHPLRGLQIVVARGRLPEVRADQFDRADGQCLRHRGGEPVRVRFDRVRQRVHPRGARDFKGKSHGQLRFQNRHLRDDKPARDRQLRLPIRIGDHREGGHLTRCAIGRRDACEMRDRFLQGLSGTPRILQNIPTVTRQDPHALCDIHRTASAQPDQTRTLLRPEPFVGPVHRRSAGVRLHLIEDRMYDFRAHEHVRNLRRDARVHQPPVRHHQRLSPLRQHLRQALQRPGAEDQLRRREEFEDRLKRHRPHLPVVCLPVENS